MSENEDFSSYVLWVDEVVNGIKGIGGELKEDEAMKKILRSLPKSYSHKISTIEESKDLDKYSMYQVYGALTAFETREFDKDSERRKKHSKSMRR